MSSGSSFENYVYFLKKIGINFSDENKISSLKQRVTRHCICCMIFLSLVFTANFTRYNRAYLNRFIAGFFFVITAFQENARAYVLYVKMKNLFRLMTNIKLLQNLGECDLNINFWFFRNYFQNFLMNTSKIKSMSRTGI